MVDIKGVIRYFIVLAFFSASINLVSGQTKKKIIGKWKLEAMKDTAGHVFDITTNGEVEVPKIFQYLTINKKGKGIFRNGDKDYKVEWYLHKDNRFVYIPTNNAIRSYKIIKLTSDSMVLEIEIGNREFIGLLYYTRV